MEQYKTEQEKFWAGEFGDEYNKRTLLLSNVLQNRLIKWRKILSSIKILKSCIEFGPNVGYNIMALERLFPSLNRTGVEINEKACLELKKIDNIEIINSSILNFTPTKTYDLSFTNGLLIHINPDALKTAYQTLYNSSHKYILINEYYSLEPMEIPYRGHKEKLFKRDFADELLKQYPDLTLIDYGFFYHNDSNCSEDSNWFLFEK